MDGKNAATESGEMEKLGLFEPFSFKDRADAGKLLADSLETIRFTNPYILALPRGGVIVAEPVASCLNAPIDVVITRKLSVPRNEEYAFGAIGPDGFSVIHEDIVRRFRLTDKEVLAAQTKARGELSSRLAAYQSTSEYPDLTDRDVILVDDGIATGSTLEVAISYVQTLRPRRTIIAVPVSESVSAARLARRVDKFICLHTPTVFSAVGQWYEGFSDVSDEEVKEILSNFQHGNAG